MHVPVRFGGRTYVIPSTVRTYTRQLARHGSAEPSPVITRRAPICIRTIRANSSRGNCLWLCLGLGKKRLKTAIELQRAAVRNNCSPCHPLNQPRHVLPQSVSRYRVARWSASDKGKPIKRDGAPRRESPATAAAIIVGRLCLAFSIFPCPSAASAATTTKLGDHFGELFVLLGC